MICAHFKKLWVVERNHVRGVITTNKVSQATFELLKKENFVIGTELRSLKVAYTSLKE
jgi:hypothetical protein